MNISFKSWPFPRMMRLILAVGTAIYALLSGHYWVLIFTALLLYLVVINYGCPFLGKKGCSTNPDGQKPVIQQFKKYKP